MLMTPKSQRQVCHCLPSQDAAPSQLKAFRRDSASAWDVHLCPEPEKGECKGAGGAGAGRCSLVAQSFKRTSEIQVQQQGPVGRRVQQGSRSLCTSLPTTSEKGNSLLLPTVLPIPVHLGALGWQGQWGDVHFCRKSWWGRR